MILFPSLAASHGVEGFAEAGRQNSTMEKTGEKKVSEFSVILKILIFTLPSILVTEVVHSKNHVVIAGSWVVGALLQTLIPPARKGLLPILALTVIVGIAYVIFGGASL